MTYRTKYDLWLDPAVVSMVKYVHETDDLSHAIERMIKSQLRNGITPKCPDGCNPKQFEELTQSIQKQEVE